MEGLRGNEDENEDENFNWGHLFSLVNTNEATKTEWDAVTLKREADKITTMIYPTPGAQRTALWEANRQVEKALIRVKIEEDERLARLEEEEAERARLAEEFPGFDPDKNSEE